MAPVWGDGFAGDGLAKALCVADWDSCSTDEYAVLFPRLLPADRAFAPALRLHLEGCVVARAWRIAHIYSASPAYELRSRAPSVSAVALHGAWFTDDGVVDCLLRRIGLLRTPPERIVAERRLLAVLDAVLDGIQRGAAPAWSEDWEAWFAFGSGIHPAYLWAEGALSPDRGLAAAWLGHLDRGRTALMPLAVADYLVDAVLDRSRPRDRTLAAMVGAPEDGCRLRRAVARRLAGHDPTVALVRGRRSMLAMPHPALQERALEHI